MDFFGESSKLARQDGISFWQNEIGISDKAKVRSHLAWFTLRILY